MLKMNEYQPFNSVIYNDNFAYSIGKRKYQTRCFDFLPFEFWLTPHNSK